MKKDESSQRGYVFALPRVIVGLVGKKPRRAEWSRAEAYGVGLLVYAIGCVFFGRETLIFVRPTFARLPVLLIVPVAVWAFLLLLYYLVSLVIRLLRNLHLYSGRNDRFQHYVIMLLTSLIALHFLRQPLGWMGALGTVWLFLLGANIFCIFFERLLDEP
jgi:hypothetical protein